MSAVPGPPLGLAPPGRRKAPLLPTLRCAARVAGGRAAFWLEPVLALVFPSTCAGCHAALSRPARGPFCAACWGSLPRHRQARCRCGVTLGRAAGGTCGRCRRGLNPLGAGASLGPYEGALRLAVHQLKFRGKRRLAARLADALLEDAAVRAVLSDDALLVPVPLHPRRLRERGFNQAALLARVLARRTGLPHEEALRRRRDTLAQAGLSAARRRANVRAAFVVRRPARVRGRTVVLVDDVHTTGATSLACAHALRAAGAAEVRLITVARA